MPVDGRRRVVCWATKVCSASVALRRCHDCVTKFGQHRTITNDG